MNDNAAARWSNHDISSDGRIVEECIRTAADERRITWYDRRGEAMGREDVDARLHRRARGLFD